MWFTSSATGVFFFTTTALQIGELKVRVGRLRAIVSHKRGQQSCLLKKKGFKLALIKYLWSEKISQEILEVYLLLIDLYGSSNT